MDGKALEAALLPWAGFEARPEQPSEAVVGAEANMILEILRFAEASTPASPRSIAISKP
ncbi:unnamed protein product [Symbiodinium natans]|uniref:Uncharacterized protein n=1 Tax=Symbiodinium natans TaxID=878477 RepID=A0A812MJC3_9DINO|nr:unnamed protein product [Symbiodinium natans]